MVFLGDEDEDEQLARALAESVQTATSLCKPEDVHSPITLEEFQSEYIHGKSAQCFQAKVEALQKKVEDSSHEELVHTRAEAKQLAARVMLLEAELSSQREANANAASSGASELQAAVSRGATGKAASQGFSGLLRALA